MSEIQITVIMFAAMLMLMTTGFPISFGLASVGVISGFFLWGPSSLDIVYFSTMDVMKNFLLIAVPLFVFMGYILHESGIANDLFDTVQKWAGGLRGGLGMGTIVICAIMAAMVGISGAATLSMGVVAVPAMLNRNYDKKIAIGLVQAGGALGFLIPPSMMMIMFAFISGVSTGKLFVGGVIPGLLLVTLYILYIRIRSHFQPSIAPGLKPEERATWGEKIVSLKSLILPGILIIGVLGCIFFGITSPTEAAAVGAFGSLLCAAVRKNLSWRMLKSCALNTLNLSAFTAYIVIGAIIFSKVYTGLGATAMIKAFVTGVDVSPWVILIIMQASFFLLGMFMDDIAILFMTMPIYVPLIIVLGFNPVWFGVLYVVNMQMAFITPPYGVNLFYMKAVAPKGVTMDDIYASVIPFIIIQAIALVLLMLFPDLILFLPKLLFSSG